MIDITLPIEFEDGTPLELGDMTFAGQNEIYVEIPEGTIYDTKEPSGCPYNTTYWYNKHDGTFGGSGPNETNYKRIRNVDPGPPLVDIWE